MNNARIVKLKKAKEMLDAFEKWVTFTQGENGYWKAACKKHFFAVTSHYYDACRSEALHYFQQYYCDGEYDE